MAYQAFPYVGRDYGNYKKRINESSHARLNDIETQWAAIETGRFFLLFLS